MINNKIKIELGTSFVYLKVNKTVARSIWYNEDIVLTAIDEEENYIDMCENEDFEKVYLMDGIQFYIEIESIVKLLDEWHKM